MKLKRNNKTLHDSARGLETRVPWRASHQGRAKMLFADRQANSYNNIAYLQKISVQFKKARIPSAVAEAEQLIETVARIESLKLFTGDYFMGVKTRRLIERAAKLRLSGNPLSYITGQAEFCGLLFQVNPDVLIPRPETEILVEETLKIVQQYYHKSLEILEIGTGSGCIAVCLTKQVANCRMTALDVSSKALRVARKNAKRNGVAGRIRFLKSNLFSNVSPRDGVRWDMIVSNPPYIEKAALRTLQREVQREPRVALDGGEKGLEIIFKILNEAPRHLEKQGWLLLEIGYGQSRAIAKKIRQDGVFTEFRFVKDLAGIDRILIARNG